MSDLPFTQWVRQWIALASYSGAYLPDSAQRIEAVIALWNEPVPSGWQRGLDARLLDPRTRHGRNHSRDPSPAGEHALEIEVLGALEATLLGALLVDGVSAVPLSKDVSGGREGNVEADMLLLVRDERGYRLQIVEVKTRSNNAWYAVVENLRQLRLFREGAAVQTIFQGRCPQLALPTELPLEGVVLAPRTFYADTGQKYNAVEPAEALCGQMRTEAGVDVSLAVWESERTTATYR